MDYNNLTTSDIEALQQQSIEYMTHSALVDAYRTAVDGLRHLVEERDQLVEVRDSHFENTQFLHGALDEMRQTIVAVVERGREAMADGDVSIDDWDEFEEFFREFDRFDGVDLSAPRRKATFRIEVSATIEGTCYVTDPDVDDILLEARLVDNGDWFQSVDFLPSEFDDVVDIELDSSYVDFDTDSVCVDIDD